MFKKVLYGLLAFCAIGSIQSKAQTLPAPQHEQAGAVCGTDPAFMRSLGINPLAPGPGAMILPGSFPAPAVETCGKFRVFYEDRAIGSGQGFDAAGSVGLNRRNILCQVLNDIQDQFDFSSIPSGQYIRLHVDTSFGITYHPAPFGTDFYARGGPYYPASGTPVTNGFLNSYVKTGADPAAATGYYHANIQLNFAYRYVRDPATGGYKTIPEPLNYYESLGSSIGYCQVDLYSQILHEITHCLGWVSLVEISGTSLGTTVFSSIDTAVTVVNQAINDEFSTKTKAISGGVLSVSYPLKQFWMNNNYPPYNDAIFSVEDLFTYAIVATNFMHLNNARHAYHHTMRQSPGDYQNYVMAYFITEGTMERSYTKGEIRTLHETLGYPYKSALAGSPLVTNRIPYSTRMSSPLLNNLYYTQLRNNSIAESLPVDATLRNDVSASYTYTLSADTSLHDDDGDVLSIYPGSLVNFRGGGEGGNNHNLLTVSPDGKSVLYQPRKNFYGKVQFGYNLYDNKEKGAFHIVTINVTKGNNVSLAPGENMLMNGTFEEGSEVKLKSGPSAVNNSSSIASRLAGRLQGANYADGQPQGFLAYSYTPWSGGTLIKDSYSACSDFGALPYAIGGANNSFPRPISLISGPFPGVDQPLQPGDTGNRYLGYLSTGPTYFYLTDSLKPCRKYIVEFDVFSPYAALVTSIPKTQFFFGFTDSAKANLSVMDFYTMDRPMNHSISPSFDTLLPNSWAHIRIPFDYCSATASDIMSMQILTGLYKSDIPYFLDNFSLKEDTTKPTLAILDSFLAPCHNTKLIAAARKFNRYHCSGYGDVDYYWTVGADTISRDSMIFAGPASTTTYVAHVADGCTILKDTITITGSPGLRVAARDTTICYGDTIALNYTVSGATGTLSYSWTPAAGLSCTTCAFPLTSTRTTTKYKLKVSDAISCFEQEITVTVRPKPVWRASNDTGICPGRSVMLSASGLSTYSWSPATGLSCTSCDITTASPSVTTSYILNMTDSFGCKAKDTVTVSILPRPAVTITATPKAVCGGEPVSLTASGGLTQVWHPAPGLIGCSACPTTVVQPVSDQQYRVVVTGINGCETFDSVMVRVRSKPIVHAVAPPTACVSSSVSVSASSTTATTYLWERLSGGSAGFSCPTCPATTIAMGATTTSYVLTGTDTNGCKGKDTFTISILPLPTIAVSTPVVSLCTPDSVTLSASGGVSYTWSPATGLSCTSCNPVRAAAPATTRTYVITGTGVNGCKNTATATINMGFCPCAPTTVFGAATTTLSGTVGSLSSGYYYVPSDITIAAGTTTFTGAKIILEAGVKITVPRTAKLILDSCHLFTCPDSNLMWQGIVLESGPPTSGRIEVRNNTLIQDALKAIACVNPSVPASGDIISVTGSTFNRNYTSISISGYVPTTPAAYPFTIRNSVISSRLFNSAKISGYPRTWPSATSLKTLLSPIDAKPSYTLTRNYDKVHAKNGELCYFGIELQGVGYTNPAGSAFAGISIGGGTSTNECNLLDNLRYGLYSLNSNTHVQNSHFVNMSRKLNPETPPGTGGIVWGGHGIYAVNNRLTAVYKNRLLVQESGGLNASIRFHDCYEAIYTEAVPSVTVYGAQFTSSHVKGGTFPGAALTTDLWGGAAVRMNVKNNYLGGNIASNRISNVHTGIDVSFEAPTAVSLTSVSGNQIRGRNGDLSVGLTNNQYVSTGIYTHMLVDGPGATTLTLYGNYMDTVENGIVNNVFGKMVATASGNEIILKDLNTVSSPQAGIRFSNTINGIVSDNTFRASALTSDYVRGVHADFNTNLKVCSNTTNYIGRGIDFSGGARAQVGTRWVLNTMNEARRGFILGSDIGHQAIMTNHTTVPITYYAYGGNKWTGTYSIGAGRYQTYTENARLPVNSIMYIRAATGETPTVNFTSASGAPAANRYAAPTTLITAQQPANCDGFIYPTRVHPFGLTGGGFKAFGLVVLGDGLGYGNDGKVGQWMNQLSLYELGMVEPDLVNYSPEFNTFMNATTGSRFGWIANVQSALANGNLSLAQSMLGNGSPQAMGRVVINTDVVITDYTDANGVVSNYADFFNLYLKYANGTLSGSDSNAIDLLAKKCPTLDGAVVFQARSLYGLISGSARLYRDDSCAYGISGTYRKTDNSIDWGNIQQGYSLYPNPNEGRFAIRQSFVDDKAMDVKVYNAVGMAIAKEKVQFTNGVANFNIENATPGLYLVCLTDEHQKTICLKFNIK